MSRTYFVRLEPRSTTGDLAPGLAARVADPLWLLGRQWQLGELLADDAPSPSELAEASMLGAEVRAMLDVLHPRERALLELRFGLNDETPLTYSEAARRLGLRRREAVRLEELALRRLRATPPISGLAAVA